MWLLTERFLARFAEKAAARGWRLDMVDDDDAADFVREHGTELEAEFGLDLTPRDYGLSLNPSLGVRHPRVDELAARFFGLSGGASQAGAALADLVPRTGRYTTWIVESEEGIDVAVRRVLSDIETYGEPFFARYTSLADLIEGLERSAGTNVLVAHLAVAHAIGGDAARVPSVLRRLEDWAAQQPPLVAQQTERFLTGFRAYFDIAAN